jgi:hypothetical protein
MKRDTLSRTRNTVRLAIAVVVLSVAGVHGLSAQSPWDVAIVAAPNPLPIGSCGSVYLTIKDSTGKDTPRSPTGQRVGIADFDLTVTGAPRSSVIGAYDGATNFQVCACQGASVGGKATISAKYPAKFLATKSRVPRVAFEASAPIVVGKARSPADPPACAAAKAGTKVKPT